MSDMITVETHLASILAAVRPLPAQTVASMDAVGFTLAADMPAGHDLPLFDNSAMDGFAVRFADVATASESSPVRLRVVADLPAGSPDDPPLQAGQAVRIMTGSAMPTAADTIVPFESTIGGLADSLGEVSVILAPHEPGASVRPRGADVRRGEVILPAGSLIGPLQLGALIAAGVSELRVTRRPRVAIVSTGDELVGPGLSLRRGQIPDSNGPLLAQLAADAGAIVVRREIVDDDGAALTAFLAEVTGGPDAVDAVISTGGISAGAYEVVRQSLPQMSFRRVAMQPGKPQGFGVAGRTLLFGLPGNPVSTAVSFEVFVRPALLALQGRTQLFRPVLRLVTEQGWVSPPRRRQYLPVVIDRTDAERWRVRPASSGGSHLAGRLGAAEGYAIVPAEVCEVSPGELVDVMLIT